jgi:uncharacterized membrane protein
MLGLLFGQPCRPFSGITLFPMYLIPTLIALLLMALGSGKWVFPVFYALLGISSGLGSTIKQLCRSKYMVQEILVEFEVILALCWY